MGDWEWSVGADAAGLRLDKFLAARDRLASRGSAVAAIDRDTSGIVLFAKHAAAQAQLKEQFLQRQPERTYQAIVYGHPNPPSGTWRDHLLWDDRALLQRQTHPRDPRGKEAVSQYRTVER